MPYSLANEINPHNSYLYPVGPRLSRSPGFKSVQCRSAGQRLALILSSAPAFKRILFTDSHGEVGSGSWEVKKFASFEVLDIHGSNNIHPNAQQVLHIFVALASRLCDAFVCTNSSTCATVGFLAITASRSISFKVIPWYLATSGGTISNSPICAVVSGRS